MSIPSALVCRALSALPYPWAFRLARLIAIDPPGVARHATLQRHHRARRAVQGLGGAWERPAALPCPPAFRPH